tara:strand:+ start:363 stop:587 length:225 start_codon:yes stop_codon:yes gene_type:complete
MLVTIIYNTDFKSNVDSLVDDLKEEWVGIKINKLGVEGSFNGTRYQVQYEGDIVYTGQTPEDNTTIINSIKERL